ncbi:MAG: RNA-binding protein [Alphaproteobacteria bacterium]|nr:RNA-binding protein [Alphaproteobacteria bacterium]
MNKKLYVSNLAFTMDDGTLEGIFAEVGSVVSAKVITDFRSGRSKGFGFVEMSSDGEAQDAIKKLNGSEIMGRTISVAEARPQEPRENRGGGGGGYRGNSSRDGGDYRGGGGGDHRGGSDRYPRGR